MEDIPNIIEYKDIHQEKETQERTFHLIFNKIRNDHTLRFCL